MDKPVLLAPAGNYECFTGAINAGADAIYLGGDRFSARAYADNFTSDEVCRAIREAHFYGRRVYLTLNTLMRDDETDEIYGYLLPMYRAGLDAVIVQDLGAVSLIMRYFPDLDIHASTQMTVTGEEGVLWLKEKGIKCVVPARELSIQEIKRIKEHTGMKLECFIHGAMCYCYSGQCLMSSMLGDRSGNRGRCAQPCRQMYDTAISGEDEDRMHVSQYPLSMRDMCTAGMIPELIEAGIDLFKIEGRMKSPEYTAGVTAVYRKYIDRYLEKGRDAYSVDEEDMNILRHLYVRSQLQDGYYNRPNGADMISGDRPGYTGNDERIISMIRDRYLNGLSKVKVSASAELKTGFNSHMEITDGIITGSADGDIVQKAQKSPVTEEALRSRLSKTGGTVIEIKADEIKTILDDGIFMQNGALNELRRSATENYIDNKISSYGMFREESGSREQCEDSVYATDVKTPGDGDAHGHEKGKTKASGDTDGRRVFKASVMTAEQLESLLKTDCSEIYIDGDLLISEYDEINDIISGDKDRERRYSVMLPYICRTSRNQDRNYLNDIMEVTADGGKINGYAVRSLDELHFISNAVKERRSKVRIISDAGLYAFNSASAEVLLKDTDGITLPYELTGHELEKLMGETDLRDGRHIMKEMIVYSSIPMMVTANCIRKTAGRCLRSRGVNGRLLLDEKTGIRDKKGIRFPVYTNCEHCYNVIYNSVPMNLYGHMKEIARLSADACRLDFVFEIASEVTRIFAAFEAAAEGSEQSEAYRLRPNAYTTGHFVHGIL